MQIKGSVPARNTKNYECTEIGTDNMLNFSSAQTMYRDLGTQQAGSLANSWHVQVKQCIFEEKYLSLESKKIRIKEERILQIFKAAMQGK